LVVVMGGDSAGVSQTGTGRPWWQPQPLGWWSFMGQQQARVTSRKGCLWSGLSRYDKACADSNLLLTSSRWIIIAVANLLHRYAQAHHSTDLYLPCIKCGKFPTLFPAFYTYSIPHSRILHRLPLMRALLTL